MKKLIMCLLLSACALTAPAQEGERSEWLAEFTEAVFTGPFRVTVEQVPETEAPRIVYDTKGSYTSRFRAEVKEGVLTVTERAESRRTSVTEVKLCVHDLRAIRVTNATLVAPEPLHGSMVDLVVVGSASVDARFDVQDLLVDASGVCRVSLSGRTRYLTLRAVTGRVDASGLEAMAVRAEASNRAEVSVSASERLESRTSTGARIRYAGEPALVRGGSGFTGGTVEKTH